MSSRRALRRIIPSSSHREVEGDPNAAGLRFAILCSRWNGTVTEALLATCRETLKRLGARERDVTVVRVPGAFELPAAAAAVLSRKPPDAVIVLGAIVRGETSHHEVLGHAVAGALATLSAAAGRPIGFGLLTCDTMAQARARVEKGAEAAEAAVEMANLSRKLARR